ncbi:MAG: DotH/IcmK family type IV secretion protein [Pseudomonadota bacterium]|nr:DotH/IcmK family type IV secretion protein [Pseudomonadota bacterium]
MQRLPVLIPVCLGLMASPVCAQVIREEPVAEIPPAIVLQEQPSQPAAAPAQPSSRPQQPLQPPVQPVAIPPQPVVGPVLPVQPLPDEVAVTQPTAEEINAQINNAAFDAALSGILPLSPEQIRELMRRVDDSQYAAGAPLRNPRPEIRVATLSLDPGIEPPEIEVSTGMVTTITMLDATGQPWPIKNVAVGGSFDVPQPEEGSHIIRVIPMTKYTPGNLSVTLVNLATPITFRLKTGGDVVHYRFDARIPEYGPNAQIPIIDRAAQVSAGDGVIMAVLDGTPPAGAQKLTVTGVDSRTAAWKAGDTVFLRTTLKLLSPAWEASVSSADGMTVYSIPDTPVVMLSDNGVPVRARLALREKVNEY